MVRRIPKAKRTDTENALLVDIFPCPLTKPTMSGMLARWQGLSKILRIPHTMEAKTAIKGAPSIARPR
jgi:hypothetical protein